ncbi:MAG: thioredoxin family protein [Candidatus Micrarchaeota archaeon]|nr:thioredoxin family protein [Candidatus Micrarchaeota archaeon]MDE1855581.1 thioredoxin family protein [Candidatus Micrarchaeota archaeon]
MVRDLDARGWDEALGDASKPLVVEFWHDQCIWCKRLAPIYDEIEKDYPGVSFARLNILSSAENSAIGEKNGVMGTPTTKVFCEGREVGEIVGFMEKGDFKLQLDGILKNSGRCLKSTTPINGDKP